MDGSIPGGMGADSGGGVGRELPFAATGGGMAVMT